MNSPKFIIGVLIGSVAFAFVMIILWAWDIVPIEQMREFNSKPANVYILSGIALGSMMGGGYLFAAIFDKKKK